MVTTGMVAAALVVGLVGTTWQAIRATRAERQAQANEQHAIDERDQKEAARREALASAEQARAAAESERQAKEAEAAQRKLAEAAAQSERQARESETQQRQKAEASEKQAAEEAAVAKAVNDFLQQDLLGHRWAAIATSC